MKNKNMQWFVHRLIERYADHQTDALDLTMGNGHDTCFLTEHFRHVYAFDKQSQALESTRQRLAAAHKTNVTLTQCDHGALLINDVPHVSLIVFNAGYLPGGDKSMITQATSTVHALKTAFEALRSPGVLIMTLYTHPGGLEEKEAVVSWLNQLPHARLSRYHLMHVHHAPEVYVCEI